MTLLGMALAAFATWRAAGRITEPLARLDHAAGRLASGEHVKVQVRGEDELARLAATFNEMSGKIEEREKRITQLAFNDVLTGLPNRTMFQQQLEHLYRSIEDGEFVGGASLPRPRPVQGDQRHARASCGRRPAHRGTASASVTWLAGISLPGSAVTNSSCFNGSDSDRNAIDRLAES